MKKTDMPKRKIEFTKTQGRWWAVTLSSGADEYRGCSLTLIGFRRYLSIPLPAILKPHRHWVDTSKYEWASAAGGYWDEDRRDFGVSLFDGHFCVKFGRQADDSSIDQDWGCFLPWTEWRHVRYSVYDLDGKHVWTEPVGRLHGTIDGWRERHEERERVMQALPKARFAFKDFDGEDIEAEAFIEERQWKFGTKWFKWLSLFRRDRVRRSLDLKFSKEVGKRKGSWKGGTIGHGIDMLPGEFHEAAFRRYCAEHKLQFIGRVLEPA